MVQILRIARYRTALTEEERYIKDAHKRMRASKRARGMVLTDKQKARGESDVRNPTGSLSRMAGPERIKVVELGKRVNDSVD